ncbi:hypothetical protein HJFPF1_12652 [Paramyrothecium foliicola]|nr:hypothetical protein HJFPF1_12652 [Paramyrothecium foliicola]
MSLRFDITFARWLQCRKSRDLAPAAPMHDKALRVIRTHKRECILGLLSSPECDPHHAWSVCRRTFGALRPCEAVGHCQTYKTALKMMINPFHEHRQDLIRSGNIALSPIQAEKMFGTRAPYQP